MVDFPLVFEAYAESEKEASKPWMGSINNHEPIKCGLPPEFSGPGGCYTSGELLVLAVINSIIARFKYSCEKKGLSFQKIKARGILKLDMGSEDNFIFTSLDIFGDVEGASDKDRIKEILEEAIALSEVSQCIKIPKVLHVSVD